jgi:hypothetical protein
MVSQRLKETPKAAQPSKVAVQRRTLMSMRWAESCSAQAMHLFYLLLS